MAKKMTKAQMEAFKKNNFDKSKKVSSAQLDKLRKEGTPAKAIAKYKNDPAMREALNRFYGKDRVSKTAGSTSTSASSTVRGGPGAKMPKRPAGGPGAKMTARDGRGVSSTSTSTSTSKTKSTGTTRQTAREVTGTNAYANQAATRRKALENMTPEQRKRSDQLARIGRDVILPASLAAIPVGGGAAIARGAYQTGAKLTASAAARKGMSPEMLKREFDIAYKAAKKAGFKNFGAKTAPKATPKVTPKATPKKTAPKVTPKATPKVTPKSKTAAPKAPVSGTAKQADEMLTRLGKLPRKYKKTTAAVAGAAYLARPNKKDQK
jgi:hypothetical protein